MDQIQIQHNLYLRHMLLMNRDLEKNERKLFQPICLRTETTNKYVHFNSSALKDIFNKKHAEITNQGLWDTYFNIKEKYNTNGFTFNHMISTDGIGVSINLINNNLIEKNNNTKIVKATASKKTRAELKNKTDEEKVQYKLNKQIKEEDRKAALQKATKERNEKRKEDFKKLPKEQQDRIKLEIKLKKNKCEYIEDAVKKTVQYNKLKNKYDNKQIAVCDPGKRTLLTILGMRLPSSENEIVPKNYKKRDNKTLFSYNNRNRLKETKRLKYSKLILNKKNKTKINGCSIKDYEKKLCEYNTKTMDNDKFLEYTKEKIQMRDMIATEIKYNEYLNKLKWFAHINRCRHEDKLLNKIATIFGTKTTFILGDWSKGNCIKYISTPNKKMKKLLMKRFEVLMIDEYKTSKLYYKNETEGDNQKVIRKELQVKLHSVLTFKMGNNNECINRDYNATQNMLKIVKKLIETKERPEEYSRKPNLPREVKPQMVKSAIGIENCVHIEGRTKIKKQQNKKNKEITINIEKVNNLPK